MAGSQGSETAAALSQVFDNAEAASVSFKASLKQYGN